MFTPLQMFMCKRVRRNIFFRYKYLSSTNKYIDLDFTYDAYVSIMFFCFTFSNGIAEIDYEIIFYLITDT